MGYSNEGILFPQELTSDSQRYEIGDPVKTLRKSISKSLSFYGSQDLNVEGNSCYLREVEYQVPNVSLLLAFMKRKVSYLAPLKNSHYTQSLPTASCQMVADAAC